MFPVGPGTDILVLCPGRGIPIHGPSGASAHVRGVARALARTGSAARVAAPLTHDHRGQWDLPLGLPHITRPTRVWPRALRRLGARLDGRALVSDALAAEPLPTWMWERHTLAGMAGAQAAERHDIPRLIEVNAPLCLERQRFSDLRHPRAAWRDERHSLQQADRVVVVSEWLADWVVRAAGVHPDRVRHVPNGTAQPPPSVDRTLARGRLGVGERLLVGFVGSMKPWHGLGRLPAILDALGPNALGLAVGSGPGPVPRHPRLRLIPQVQPAALWSLVAALDVALAPYPDDAPPWFCPLKVLTYRAQGVPVVATDVGDSRGLVGAHGRVLSDATPRQWAAAIRDAATLPRLPYVRSWDTVISEAAG